MRKEEDEDEDLSGLASYGKKCIQIEDNKVRRRSTATILKFLSILPDWERST
jgi:hypothetical protein